MLGSFGIALVADIFEKISQMKAHGFRVVIATVSCYSNAVVSELSKE